MRDRRYARGCVWGCGGVVFLGMVLVAGLLLILSKVPRDYPPADRPVPPPDGPLYVEQELDGFASPYLGHSGSWNGKGRSMGGRSKTPWLDAELAMGLRWTFMCVYWRAMEPRGPVHLDRGIPDAWKDLDGFVIQAHERGLNILMQAPVIGGNAGGPPDWAGRREEGKSAPRNLEAAVAFAARLAERYRPGGTLAREQGWGTAFGVRAWELDNEPESYRTHWKGQAGDYAEFATRIAEQIRIIDPRALILTPGIAGGGGGLEWVRQALDADALQGSPVFQAAGIPYSIGPVTDVVSFHCYEGLDTALSGNDRTIERTFSDIRAQFDEWEQGAEGLAFAPHQEFWHTEGNFDFFGILSRERRAAWRWQFFTRAFAAGIRKVCVMDPCAEEQAAITLYVRELSDPFPMLGAREDVQVLEGNADVFRHTSGAGQTWVLWARADTGDAVVSVPVENVSATAWHPDGTSRILLPRDGMIRLTLAGDRKMAAPVILVDRPDADDPR